MNAPTFPPFPLNPSVGQFFGNWVWNGARWVCSPASGVRVIITTFNASGPYMPSPGLVTAVVEAIAGGAGGGGALGTATAAAAGWMVGGGGGAAGGYSRAALAASLVAGGVQVNVGAGGTAGTPTPLANGGQGGDSSFGGLVLAHGGLGGGSANPGGGGPGHAPAVGIGDIAVTGNPGGAGGGILSDPGFSGGGIWGGIGGAGFFGGAGAGGYGSIGGSAAPGGPGEAGGGGGGAASASTTLPANGGVGGTGLVVVTEYCWADSGSNEDCCPPGQSFGVNARVAVTDERGGGRQGGQFEND
jgi:hypothetical protein